MNALFWWTGFVWWACVVMAGVLTVALWVKGKMMARGVGRDREVRQAKQGLEPCSTPAPVPGTNKALSEQSLRNAIWAIRGYPDGPVRWATLDELMPTVVDE